jgi:hypothetical protein
MVRQLNKNKSLPVHPQHLLNQPVLANLVLSRHPGQYRELPKPIITFASAFRSRVYTSSARFRIFSSKICEFLSASSIVATILF